MTRRCSCSCWSCCMALHLCAQRTGPCTPTLQESCPASAGVARPTGASEACRERTQIMEGTSWMKVETDGFETDRRTVSNLVKRFFLVLAHLSSHSHCKSIRPLQVNTHRPPLSGAPEPGKEVGPEVTELVGVRPEHSFEVAGVVSMQQAHHRRRQDHRSHRNGGLHCELRYNSKQIGCMIGCRVGFMVRLRI